MSTVIFSESSGLNDSLFGKSQHPIKAIINESVEAFEKTSLIAKIFGIDGSENFAEKYTSETALGDFKNVGENGTRPVSGFQEGFSKVIEPATWKNSFEVTREMVEDNKISKLRKMANGFTLSFNRTREKFAASLLAGGTANTATIDGKSYDTTCADGKPLFAVNHPSKTKGTELVQSNAFTAAFSMKIMDTVQEKMQDFKDDDGNLLSVCPDTIIIPNSAPLKRAVMEAVGSDLDPNTNNNAMNFQQGNWNVLVWPYLPKTIGGKPYFMMMDSQFKDAYDCLPWVDRVKLTVRSFIDDDTDANVWSGRARFGAGFNNWRCIAICGEGVTGTSLTA